MHPSHPLVGLAAIALASTATAQYQTQNRTARATALKVSEFGTPTNGLSSSVTLEGSLTAPYFLFMEPDSVANLAHGFPGTAGELYEPICLDLGNPALFDLTPFTTGAFPPVSQTFAFPPSPAMIGSAAEFQAWSINPGSPFMVALSNGVRRAVGGPLAPSYEFAPAPVVATPGEYIDIEQADVDGDGDQDTFVLNCDGSIEFIENLQTEDLFPGAMHPKSVTPGVVQILPGLITPNSGLNPSTMELADIDNDNWYDLIVGGSIGGVEGVSVFLNPGRPAPPPASSILGPWPGFAGDSFVRIGPTAGPYDARDLEVADMDGDGLLDIVVATDGVNRLLLNAGTGFGTAVFAELVTPFSAGVDDSWDVEVADFDGDDLFDIVVANGAFSTLGPGFEVLYTNAGGGLLDPGVALPASGGFTCDVAVGDFNGDGFLDVYGCETGPAPFPSDQLHLGTGPGTFALASFQLPDNAAYAGPAALGLAPLASSDAEAVDFDRDGVPEIAVAHGFKCLAGDASAFDLRILDLVPASPTGPFWFDQAAFDLDPDTGLGFLAGIGINDLETGDWQLLFPDADLGIAHRPSLAGAAGTSVLLR